MDTSNNTCDAYIICRADEETRGSGVFIHFQNTRQYGDDDDDHNNDGDGDNNGDVIMVMMIDA